MGLMKVPFDKGLKQLSDEERKAWDNSLCKDCAGFDSFLYDDNPVYPAYYCCHYPGYVCSRNVSFVSEAMKYGCSFYKGKSI